MPLRVRLSDRLCGASSITLPCGLRLAAEHFSESTTRPHEAHEGNQFDKFFVGEVFPENAEHFLVDAGVV